MTLKHSFVFLSIPYLLTACGGGDSNNSVDTFAATNSYSAAAGTKFTGKRADYTITRNSTGYTVNDNRGNDGTRVLSGSPQVVFSDVTVNFGMLAKAETIDSKNLTTLIELYIAFFNRVPDADGLAYWVDQFKAGATIDQIADTFYNAAVQYSSLTGYSSTMTTAEFVKLIYKNVLGRSGPLAPEESAVVYWSLQLQSGQASKGSLVRAMLSSAHSFKGNSTWGWVADLLDNKVSVGTYFAVDQGLNFNTSEESISKGMAISSAITATDTSAAITLIGQPDPVNLRPTANAGISITANIGGIVTLDGTKSSTTTGNQLKYAWTFASKPVGSLASLTFDTTPQPRFTPDVPGNYVFTLIVNDGSATSTSASITVTGTDITRFLNQPYIARNGMTVTLTAFDVTDTGSYYQYDLTYAQKNNTSNKLDEGTMSMYFSNSERQTQYGFFGTLYPGDSMSRRYTFKGLKSEIPSILEYDHDHFFASNPIKGSVQWKLPLNTN
jgi:hypothetical protein